MEKVLQILVVFGLLMLLIWRSIRGREERFRRFSYLARIKPPLMEEVGARLVRGQFGWAGGRGGDGGRGVPEDGEGQGGEGQRGRGALEDGEGQGGEGQRGRGALEDADAYLWDEDRRLLLLYWAEGKLVIYRRTAGGRNRELQELAVPMDCTGLGWDPQERRIYLEEDGDWFVYGEEG